MESNASDPWVPSPKEIDPRVKDLAMYWAIQLHQGMGSPAHHIIATAKEFLAYMENDNG